MYTLEMPVQDRNGKYFLKTFSREEVTKLYRQLLLETNDFYVETSGGVIWEDDLLLAVDTYNLFNENERIVWY